MLTYLLPSAARQGGANVTVPPAGGGTVGGGSLVREGGWGGYPNLTMAWYSPIATFTVEVVVTWSVPTKSPENVMAHVAVAVSG